jgi:hypothetical protein
MSQVREAQVFEYLLLASQLEESGETPNRPGSAELTALGQSVADLYAWLSLQPPEPFPTSLPLGDGAAEESILYPRHEQPEWKNAQVGDRACRAFARVDQGTVVLQRAAGQRGAAQGATWNHLRAALGQVPPVLQSSRFFWGTLICYGGRVADETAACAAAEAALPADPAGRSGHTRCARLGADLWLCDRLGLPDTVALFCADNDAAEARASDYFNDVLPTAANYLKKVAYFYDKGYKSVSRRLLRRLEGHLAKALARARWDESDAAETDTAEKLEEHLRDIAQAYGNYAAALALFKEIQNTVAVNAGNLKELLDKHGMPREGPPAAWRAVVSRAVEQLAADDRYYEARTREAEITLRVLEARAELEREKQERRENYLAEKRNYGLNLLILAIGYATVILTFVSDDTVKALIRWWNGSEKEGEFQLGALLVGKLTMGLLLAAGLSLLWLAFGRGLPLIGRLSKKKAGRKLPV